MSAQQLRPAPTKWAGADSTGSHRYLLPLGLVVTLYLAVGSAYLLGVGRTSLAMILVGSVLAAVAGVAVLRSLELGVALLPLMATAVPLTVGTGTQSPIVFALVYTLLILGLWIIRWVLRQRVSLARSAVNLPLVTLTLVWVVSYLYNDATHSPFVWQWDSVVMPRLGQLAVVLASFIAMLLAANASVDVRWIRIATWSVVGFSVVPLAGFYLHVGAVDSYVSAAGLFTMWAVALAYGQALFNGNLPRWLRLGLVGLVAAWMFKAVVIQNSWLSGWVPALVAVVAITFFRSKRVSVVLVLALAVSALLFPQLADNLVTTLYQSQVNEGDLTRLGIWGQAWGLFSAHPFLGTGPAGYAYYYWTVYRGSQFSLSTHSGYMDILLETGLLGSLAFLWLLVSLARAGWQACRRWQSGFEGGFAFGVVGGFFGVLVATSLGDWLLPFVYNQTIAGYRYTVHSWIFLGMLAGLARLSAAKAVPQSRP